MILHHCWFSITPTLEEDYKSFEGWSFLTFLGLKPKLLKGIVVVLEYGSTLKHACAFKRLDCNNTLKSLVLY